MTISDVRDLWARLSPRASLRGKIALVLLIAALIGLAAQIVSQGFDQHARIVGSSRSAHLLLSQIIARQLGGSIAERNLGAIGATIADIVHVTKNGTGIGPQSSASESRPELIAIAVFDPHGKRFKKHQSAAHAHFDMNLLAQSAHGVLESGNSEERDVGRTHIIALPSTNAKDGTLAGILVIAWDLAAKQASLRASLWRSAGLGFLAMLALIAICVLAVNRIAGAPIARLTGIMARLADGDEKTEIPNLERRDEIGAMARSLTTIRDTGVRAARIQTALDNASSVTLMASPDGDIIYANQAARAYFKEAEGAIQVRDAAFAADRLIGQDATRLFPDPENIRARLARLDVSVEERLGFGGRTARLRMSPVVAAGDNRLGTVIEWDDLTLQLQAEAEKAARQTEERVRANATREEELSFQKDLSAVIDAAAAGDFSQRLELGARRGIMRQLGESLNRLLQHVMAAVDELVAVNGSLAKGDLSARVRGDYGGALRRLKEDTNLATGTTSEAVRRVIAGMFEIKGATTELNVGARDLSGRTETQVAALEEMAASIRQLSASVKRNAESAQQASDLVMTARGAAENAQGIAASAVDAVGRIDESSRRIGDIVGLMDEIAFQTNLLALNAAVEAARAGDAGRGFAVVAQEVRALAQRSSEASKDIKTLIADSNRQVKTGVELVNEAGRSLQQITRSVKDAADFVAEIAAASNEQSASVGQVDRSVTQLEAITQQNAALVEESTTSLNSVDRQVDGLLDAVGFFKVKSSDRMESDAPRSQRRASA